MLQGARACLAELELEEREARLQAQKRCQNFAPCGVVGHCAYRTAREALEAKWPLVRLAGKGYSL